MPYFVRRYDSPYFQKYFSEARKERNKPLVEKIKDARIDAANVWMIHNHILNATLDLAVKVHNGQMSSDDDCVEHVFRVMYRAVEQYFKKEEVIDNDKEKDFDNTQGLNSNWNHIMRNLDSHFNYQYHTDC